MYDVTVSVYGGIEVDAKNTKEARERARKELDNLLKGKIAEVFPSRNACTHGIWCYDAGKYEE